MPAVSLVFSVFERLPSAKLNQLVSEINSHSHDGSYGVQISFSNLSGTSDVVMASTAQDIDGVKTFYSSPIVPIPTTDYQAAPKKYVDDTAKYGARVSINNNQVYGPAATDLDLFATCSGAASSFIYAIAYVGPSSGSLSQVAIQKNAHCEGDTSHTVFTTVRKGEYFKVYAQAFGDAFYMPKGA